MLFRDGRRSSRRNAHATPRSMRVWTRYYAPPWLCVTVRSDAYRRPFRNSASKMLQSPLTNLHVDTAIILPWYPRSISLVGQAAMRRLGNPALPRTAVSCRETLTVFARTDGRRASSNGRVQALISWIRCRRTRSVRLRASPDETPVRWHGGHAR